MMKAGNPSSGETPSVIGRHDTFYIDDELVVFQVENTLFRVHRHFFRKNSKVFESMFSLPPGEDNGQEEGRSDQMPIHLPGLMCRDFERFLTLFYPQNITTGDLSGVEDWTSVLAVATRYDFETYRELAISRLAQLAPAAQRVRLARQHAVTPWLVPAYYELSTRKEPLTLAEGEALGMRDVVLISEIRHVIRGAQNVAVQERSVLLQINGKLI